MTYYIRTEQGTYNQVDGPEHFAKARWFWQDTSPILEAWVYVEDETMGRWLKVAHPFTWQVKEQQGQ